MYNNKSLFVANPINRYAIGEYTEGLKNNTDDSLDIYIQHAASVASEELNGRIKEFWPKRPHHLTQLSHSCMNYGIDKFCLQM